MGPDIPHSITSTFVLDSDNLNWANQKFCIPTNKKKEKLLTAGYDSYADVPHRPGSLSLTTMTMTLT